MDHLEKFIRDHREEMDVHTPSDQVWDQIKQEIVVPKQKKGNSKIISLRWISAIAASVVFAVFAWNIYLNSNDPDPMVADLDPYIEAIDPTYAQQVKFVNLQIQEKQTELRTLVKDYPDISENLLESLEHLNTSYDALRISLEENINQEVLLKAMIENLNLQVTILNQQLNLIQQIKNENTNEINI